MEQTHGRALIYCRVSSESQEDNTSLQSQEVACIAEAKRRGYQIAQVTKEVFTGSEILDRPKFKVELQKILAREYDAVIVYDVDRFSRDNIGQLLFVTDQISKAGVELIFVLAPLDKTPEGQLMLAVKGYAAQNERLKIRERCIRGKRQRALNGLVHNAGSELYGYRRDKERGVREIYEDEARVVRQIFQWIIEGVSTRKVIQRLNEQGIPSPSASDNKRTFKDGRTPFWGKGAIARILKEETYKGVTYAQRFKSAKTWREINSRPKEEWIRLPDHTTPPIVSPEDWQAAQERLKTNCGNQTRNERRQDLLRGMVFCSICKSKMYGGSEHNNYRIYRCPSRHSPKGACGSKRIPATDCESLVWQHISNILQNPQVIKDELKRRESTGRDLRSEIQAELESARRQHNNLESEIENLVRRAATASDSLWRRLEKEIAQKEEAGKRIKANIVNLESRLALDFRAGKALDSLFEYCQRVRSNLANFGFEEKRLALEALGARLDGSARDWTLKIQVPLAGYAPTSCC